MAVNVVSLPTHPPSRARERIQLAATPVNPDALYSPKQIQAWFGIGPSTYYRMLKANKLPPTRKVGRLTMTLGRDFLAWRDTVQ